MGKDSLIRKQHANIRYQSVRRGQLNLSTWRKILFHNPGNFQMNKITRANGIHEKTHKEQYSSYYTKN